VIGIAVEQIAWFKRYFLHRKADVVEDESQQPLPKDMPRVREIIDLRDEEKVCGCGHELVRIGEETNEKVDIISPRLRVIAQIRSRYATPAERH
jgi:transposase